MDGKSTLPVKDEKSKGSSVGVEIPPTVIGASLDGRNTLPARADTSM